MDQDGCLSVEEYSIAMHLVEKAKSGLSLPSALPAELTSSAALARARQDKEHVRRLSEGEKEDGLSFEDRRKRNFELGRMELERRRRAVQEEQERAKVRGGSWQPCCG